MSAIKDGGQAFPGYDCIDDKVYLGMTLRDYFAAKAMQGFCASPIEEAWGADANVIAQWAYTQADAMLVAREARP